MNDNYWMEIERIKKKTGIDMEKYVSEESLNEFEGNIEDSMSFVSNMLMPVIILNILLVAATAVVWMNYKSTAYTIIFFVVSLVVSVLGGGLLGLGTAVKKTVYGVTGIIKYINGTYKEIYPLINKDKSGNEPAPSEVYNLITGSVVLPVIKHVLLKRRFGGIIYKPVENSVIKSSEIITAAIDINMIKTEPNYKAENTALSKITTTMTDISDIVGPVMPKVSQISFAAVKGFTFMLKLMGILSILVGTALLGILLLIFNSVK